MSRGPARPSQPAGGVAIGGPSAASSRTPRPLTQAAGAPPSPLARLERLLLLPAFPIPLLPPPARPALCPWSPARDGGAAGAGAFSARDLDSEPAPGEVGRTGIRPPAVRPSLSTVLFSDSLFLNTAPPTLRSPSRPLAAGPKPPGTQLGSLSWGSPPGPGERPLNLHWALLPSAPLCHHLSLPTSSALFSPQGSGSPQQLPNP